MAFQTDLFQEQKEERQVPCSPLEWEVFKGFVSRMGMDVATSKKIFSDGVEKLSPRFETLARYQTVVALGGYTGLRGSDLLSLPWAKLLTSDRFRITEGKTEKSREVTLNEKLRHLIKHNHRLIKPLYDEAPILHNRTFGSISLNGFNEQLAKYFIKYGIATDNPSSHTLRKTFGLRFFEAHGRTEHAIVLLMDIFNHSTLEETRKYIGITRTVISNGYKMLD